MADNDNKNIVEEPEIMNDDPEVRGIEKSTVESVMEDSFLKCASRALAPLTKEK